MNRENILRGIVQLLPGNSAAVQRERILTAMRQLGGLTTFEMMRHLDCYDPRPRIHELRHREGYDITTMVRAEETESGVFHRIGLYVLNPKRGQA